MINLAATEQQFEDLINELLVPPLSQPAFDLTIHPGDLEDRAVGVRRGSNVIVRFSHLELESQLDKNPRANCATQINEAHFNIRVNNNNLRTHRDVYAIAEAIIKKVRGRKVAVMVNNESQLSSPISITKFSFDSYDDNKACNKAEIQLAFKYTDTYQQS